MSSTRSLPRSRTWLRVLVLLLALWVPGAHLPAQAAPAPGASTGSCEQPDVTGVLDSLVRPPARALHRADTPGRPAPHPGPAPARPATRPNPGTPPAPSVPPLLRTVVLRC